MSNAATIDTNIAIYAVLNESKTAKAQATIDRTSFISGQLLNEFSSVMSRKYGYSWDAVTQAIALLADGVGDVRPITLADTRAALRLAARYQLSFYDSLMLAVALSGGARVFYSEDLQHDLWIDDTLRVVNPFIESQP